MNWLKQFWASHKITTHSIVGAVTTLTVLYASVPAFQQLVNKAYADTPSWFHEVTTAAFAIWAFYHNSTKQ